MFTRKYYPQRRRLRSARRQWGYFDSCQNIFIARINASPSHYGCLSLSCRKPRHFRVQPIFKNLAKLFYALLGIDIKRNRGGFRVNHGNNAEAWLALDILRISRVQRMILEQPKTSAVAFRKLINEAPPSPTKQWPPMDSELLSKACKQATEVLKVLNKRDMGSYAGDHPWLLRPFIQCVCTA